MAIPNKYIDFDEIEDVPTSIELVALLAPRVGNKPSLWKSIVIAAHSTLQGATVA
jgi:hypothetical protein